MTNARPGIFVWYEHLTKDPKAAIGFYGEVVGWKTQPFDPNSSDYMMWVSSQGPLGGVTKLPDEAAKMGAPPHWMGSVCVASVDATCKQAKELGGKVLKEPADIPTVGRFAVVADPQGASIALFQPQGAMPLHDADKPGEFCWSELMTSDSKAAFAFYEKMFGWKITQEMEMGQMGTYRIFGLSDTPNGIGGMMTLPPGTPMPTAWLYYTHVSDIDAALSRATRQGGKVLNGPMEIPGGGRIAQLMDPQGAAFALLEPPKKTS